MNRQKAMQKRMTVLSKFKKTSPHSVRSGGSKGDTKDARPPLPGGPNSFNFMQFLGKFGKIVCWRPLRELAPPPRGNTGSATGSKSCQFAIYIENRTRFTFL